MMGALDNFVIKEGINLVEEWFGNAPFEYGPRFMREKYNCDPDDLHVTYRKVEEGDPNDFTECKTQQLGSEGYPDCKTPVTLCLANNGGHWWWSESQFFYKYLIMNKFFGGNDMGPLANTYNLNKEIIKFFDGIRQKGKKFGGENVGFNSRDPNDPNASDL